MVPAVMNTLRAIFTLYFGILTSTYCGYCRLNSTPVRVGPTWRLYPVYKLISCKKGGLPGKQKQ